MKATTLPLFESQEISKTGSETLGPTTTSLKRIDVYEHLRDKILPLCRLEYGGIWEDPVSGHRIGVLDATKPDDISKMLGNEKTKLIINDPPYNVVVGNANTANLPKIDLENYMAFSQKWVQNANAVMDENAHLYVWLGADIRDGFQPLPDFMMLMRNFKELSPRNWITLRKQRGYGTQKNWMWVRQELLYYVKGNPEFNVEAEYTDIPKILRGYYKKVNGEITENMERSKSQYIRAGNVWVDIQQVFYRLEENVPGCYAQKPLKAIERLIVSGSEKDDLVVDFFAHSGTTLIAGERMNRKVYTFDLDPIFAEISIRRLEHLRKTGLTGWQWRNPFPELDVLAEGRA